MEEEVDTSTLEIRPDWWVPASTLVRAGARSLYEIAKGMNHMADLMVAYSNYNDGRLEFHNEAAAELETIVNSEEN